MSDKELHARIDIHGATLMPGDPGYDNVPPTAAQEAHYTEQATDPKVLRERKANEKRSEESLERTQKQMAAPAKKDDDK